MNIAHRFHFPTDAKGTVVEIKEATQLDLHVNVGDLIEYTVLPGKTYRVDKKKFLINFDETIQRVEYDTTEVKP